MELSQFIDQIHQPFTYFSDIKQGIESIRFSASSRVDAEIRGIRSRRRRGSHREGKGAQEGGARGARDERHRQDSILVARRHGQKGIGIVLQEKEEGKRKEGQEVRQETLMRDFLRFKKVHNNFVFCALFHDA